VAGPDVWSLATGSTLHMITRGGRSRVGTTRFVTDSGGVVTLNGLRMGPSNAIDASAHLDSIPIGMLLPENGGPFWRGRLGGDVSVAGRTDDPILAVDLLAKVDTAA